MPKIIAITMACRYKGLNSIQLLVEWYSSLCDLWYSKFNSFDQHLGT